MEKRFCAIIFICKVDFLFFFLFSTKLALETLFTCSSPSPPFVCSNKHLEITDIQRFLTFKSRSKHVTLILFIYVYHLSIIFFFLFFFHIPKIRIILLKHCTSYQLIDQSLSHSTKSQTINTFRSFHSFFLFSFSHLITVSLEIFLNFYQKRDFIRNNFHERFGRSVEEESKFFELFNRNILEYNINAFTFDRSKWVDFRFFFSYCTEPR